MSFVIRSATKVDVEAILDVKQAVWPEEASSVDYVIGVLNQPDHITLVAVIEGLVVGFVDGFLTLASDGIRRWEVDLLAVHPAYRGRGIATALVRAHTQAGVAIGAVNGRALIAVDNTASQYTFAHCGYRTSIEEEYGLFVSSADINHSTAIPSGLHLIPVITINYRGLWIEGELSDGGFKLAQHIRTRYGWDVAGAVISLKESNAIRAANKAGFTLVGHYQPWQTVML